MDMSVIAAVNIVYAGDFVVDYICTHDVYEYENECIGGLYKNVLGMKFMFDRTHENKVLIIEIAVCLHICQ